MWPNDTPRPDQNPFSIKYTINKKDIPNFVNSLHAIQEQYLESAVVASKYKEAIEVINHIRNLQ